LRPTRGNSALPKKSSAVAALYFSASSAAVDMHARRNTPAKRAIGAGFALSASGMLAVVRWLFGTWAPGLHELVFSRFGAWYVLITGAAGVGLTYWLDDPNNYKINTSIRVALQGAALVVVYASISDEYCAIAAVVLLMTSGWSWAVLK
jgi:hypothetical protein